MLQRLPDPREKPWLTVAELAAITGEGEKAIRSAVDAGHLPVLRIARYVRIPTALLLTQLGIDPGAAVDVDLDDTPADTEADSSREPATATIHVLRHRTGGPSDDAAPPR